LVHTLRSKSRLSSTLERSRERQDVVASNCFEFAVQHRLPSRSTAFLILIIITSRTPVKKYIKTKITRHSELETLLVLLWTRSRTLSLSL